MQDEVLADTPGAETTQLLGEVPKRWGRMSLLSRMVLAGLARFFYQENLLAPGSRFTDRGVKVGLIGSSRRGSLATDFEFLATAEAGAGCASPALFGYTLPNIPLAEAAVFFGLTGPVYALLTDREEDVLLSAAREEACRHLAFSPGPDLMLACAFDCYPSASDKKVQTFDCCVISR